MTDVTLTTPTSWRAPAVCTLTGLSYRRLDYLARREILEPSIAGANGSGSQRVYSTDDVYVLAVLKHLTPFYSTDLTQLRPLAQLLADIDRVHWHWLGMDGPHPHLATFRDLLPTLPAMIVVDLAGIVLAVDLELRQLTA